MTTVAGPGTGPAVRRVEHVMGMPISLALRGRHADTAKGEQAWRAALAELHTADATFSTYRSDSWISRLNRGEIDLIDCPPEVSEVIDLAERARVESGGAFNVWRSGLDGRLRLDPSGIVKGWAVERASSAFDALEETDVCLSAGGDMTCRTRVPGSPGWNIGIEDPTDPTKLVTAVPLRRGALATSGTAHRGAHIIDPVTGATPTHFASITVIGEDLTWVDVDATAAFVLGARAIEWLERRSRRGVAVRSDGTVQTFGRG